MRNRGNLAKYHYFYKITNNINNHFYYGVHNTDDLEDGYMGSGTRLHYAYKKYGIENFTKEILKYFDTSEEAFEYEFNTVNEELVRDPNCYNIKCGGAGWNTFGTIVVKDKEGNTFRVLVDDPRYLSGELVSANVGRIGVIDKNGNHYKVDADDPRYLSGELKALNNIKGGNGYKDKEGNIYFLQKGDPLIKELNLISVHKGQITVKDENGKYLRVSIDDPRYLNGELKFMLSDIKRSESSKLKTKETFKTINHQKGEKNSQYGTCWIHNNNESIKIKKEELEKYISAGWIKGRKIKY